ncbi:DUF3087 domain-containing protein [Shewanella psychropiezotolerans]|uniref:DUF3087 domain-containing protein n=1 Tax=Shewanella psychropiezotolerans TaxID=2593655 RepID=A0ABX5WW10_9GAMM|nr:MULTISPECIES: DUF3087 domain-containing protein [Shewanella]MPY22894.1 DUF3087 domain-containing protein [Shewanella sp. YLB-07]QDO82577.1 DUF3087 domain-containing protein [Shewanella psychropiezotolerans]
MKLQEIDKVVYRKHLNVVTIALVTSLILLSLAFGTGLIALFADAKDMSGEATGNFHLNLLGVVMAAIISVVVLMQVKDKPYLAEVYYVWRLKALHNRVYRRLKKIKAAAANYDIDALVILSFYYQTQKQVYQLDNNTLTLRKLEKDINDLQAAISEHNLIVSIEDFNAELLNKFK